MVILLTRMWLALLLLMAPAAHLEAQGVPGAPASVRIYAGTATPPSVTINISPATVSLQPGETFQFTASVTGTANTSIVWTATGGTISGTGMYTAGSTPGTYGATATLSGGTISRSVPITVEEASDDVGMRLTDSGPMTTSHDGQVITGVRITSTSGTAALTIRHTDVVVRNVEIRHGTGHGIQASNAARLTLDTVHIVHTGAPARGPNPDDDRNNVDVFNSPDMVATRVRVRRGSSGFYVLDSPRARLSWIECHDVRGPFPRGQCVQFNKSADSLLEDFSYTSVAGASWEEDNISVYRSSNVTVRRGLVDGNNSPSGVGIMYEQDDAQTSGGLVEDVDAVRMGNGAFSGYPGHDVTFRRTRARDNICTSQDGRGTPMSNALVWAGEPSGSSGLRIEASRHYNLCNPDNLVWSSTVFSQVDIRSENFTPRAPVRLDFPWE